MGIANRLKNERRQLRNTLKEVGEAPLFYFASETGAVVFRQQNVSGRLMNVTYGFTSHNEAKTRATEYQTEWDEEVHVRNMPVGTFLAFLFHHLSQADIDIVLTDGEKPLPLTTMGVNVLQDRLWGELLNKVRETPSKNVLLAKVARDLLMACAGQGSQLAVQGADYETLVRTITGQKRAVLPTVDLGLVWFLTTSVEGTDEVEPAMLRITGKDDQDLHKQVESLGESALAENEEVIVGPLCFSGREEALSWATLLPPHLAVHLMGNNSLMLTAERGTEFLAQIRDQFPAYRAEGADPDCFVFDGGTIPLTVLGAGYVESKVNYQDLGFSEAPDRNWLTVAQGKFVNPSLIEEAQPQEASRIRQEEGITQCRNMALQLVARELGIEIVDPAAKAERESELVALSEDDGLLETAITNFMAQNR